MLMSGRIIPTIGEPPTASFDSDLELSCHLWVCYFSLQIGDQGLVQLDLSSWTHLILIGLCYMPLGYVIFSKAVPCPLTSCSCSSEPHLGPQCCLYNLLEGQPENSWPMGGKCCLISNPARYSVHHLPCFLQHVLKQHLSVEPLW